ncbi:MAG: hypothetical protein JWR37_6202 [Mycobacterium sp.]|nr:hypothetical protein [Mycobacterium sp.]
MPTSQNEKLIRAHSAWSKRTTTGGRITPDRRRDIDDHADRVYMDRSRLGGVHGQFGGWQ